jgi:hypothetical protein
VTGELQIRFPNFLAVELVHKHSAAVRMLSEILNQELRKTKNYTRARPCQCESRPTVEDNKKKSYCKGDSGRNSWRRRSKLRFKLRLTKSPGSLTRIPAVESSALRNLRRPYSPVTPTIPFSSFHSSSRGPKGNEDSKKRGTLEGRLLSQRSLEALSRW